jgi:hypothetical protein
MTGAIRAAGFALAESTPKTARENKVFLKTGSKNRIWPLE